MLAGSGTLLVPSRESAPAEALAVPLSTELIQLCRPQIKAVKVVGAHVWGLKFTTNAPRRNVD
jgi:hypothetical protein